MLATSGFEAAMKYKVGVSTEFTVLQAEIELAETKTKRLIAFTVTATVLIFLFGAALLGLKEGSFEKLQAVYTVVASSSATAVLGYYFGKDPKRRQ
jgi:hypothetical protein